MSLTVCVAAPGTLAYPAGGGHLWVGLNWTLGLHQAGCRVLWLERASGKASESKLRNRMAALKNRLQQYGLSECVALSSRFGASLCSEIGCLDLDTAAEADLLISLGQNKFHGIVERFTRSAFIDIDPGLLQIWASSGRATLARHDTYLSIGETVGTPAARFPDLGLKWHYTPPCVSLAAWHPHDANGNAPFTTLAHWHADAWMEGAPPETKRDGFVPFLDLPRRTSAALELARDLTPDDPDRPVLEARGWRLREARSVAATPWDYQTYIQSSRGEFSCAKPSCIRLQNAWVNDRTLCCLASGKPAIVQHTGPSRILPEAAGLFRFQTIEQAAAIERVVEDYPNQCRLARALAEEHFDARKVVRRVLEIAL